MSIIGKYGPVLSMNHKKCYFRQAKVFKCTSQVFYIWDQEKRFFPLIKEGCIIWKLSIIPEKRVRKVKSKTWIKRNSVTAKNHMKVDPLAPSAH